MCGKNLYICITFTLYDTLLTITAIMDNGNELPGNNHKIVTLTVQQIFEYRKLLFV